jgi:peptidoglycan/xylan/chitin deacetylase (PgdA/CDA1 family)
MTRPQAFWPGGARLAVSVSMQLEAARRRLMVIGLHERISGHPSRVRVLDRIFTRLREHDDVWWARKDQIAQWVLDHPDTAAWVDRDPAPVSGLPARSS